MMMKEIIREKEDGWRNGRKKKMMNDVMIEGKEEWQGDDKGEGIWMKDGEEEDDDEGEY